MKAKHVWIGICVTTFAGGVANLGAQTARSGGGGGSATPQMQQQLAQATAERASLQAENSKLKQDLDKASGELKKLRAERGGLERRAKASEAKAMQLSGSSDATSTTLERTRAQLQELLAKYRENVMGLATTESDRKKTLAELAKSQQQLSTCVDRNVALYEMNGTILTKLEDRSLFSKVAEREPFTRLARTRLENLIDDYRARVEELRFKNLQPKG